MINFKNKKNFYYYFLIYIFTVTYSIDANSKEQIEKWNFSVFREGKYIGSHRFIKNTTNKNNKQITVVSSKAKFTIPVFLLFNYKYQHNAKETWENKCLVKLISFTKRNGKIFKINGEQDKNTFNIKVNSNKRRIKSICISTFAYWDKDILARAKFLLNPDNGKYLPFKFIEVNRKSTLRIKKKVIKTISYRLTGKGQSITLWYDKSNGLWVRLKARLKDGSYLYYKLAKYVN